MGERWEEIYKRLLREVRTEGRPISPRHGAAVEVLSRQFALGDPRDRCLANEVRQFNIFQAIGQWLWMMAGRSDLAAVEYYNPAAPIYSADGKTLGGAYGPRLFGQSPLDQVHDSLEIIRTHKDTRRAFIAVYIPEYDGRARHPDTDPTEVPCTATLHYLPRDGALYSVTQMRAQDALGLLPYDLFFLTLLHEYVATSSALELGTYYHFANSFHFYTSRQGELGSILSARSEALPPMPAMPPGSQDGYLASVLEIEESLRILASGGEVSLNEWSAGKSKFIARAHELPEFWRTLVHSLVIWGCRKLGDKRGITELSTDVHPSIQPFALRCREFVSESRLPDRLTPVPRTPQGPEPPA